MILAELERITMEVFKTEDEGCAFAVGVLSGMSATALALEGAAAEARGTDFNGLGDTAADILEAFAQSVRETIAERLAATTTPS